MFEEVNGRSLLRWTLVFIVVGLSISYLNRNAVSERSILTDHHIPLAASLLGEGERDVATYPLWGYAGLIGALGSGWKLRVFQVVISSAALALFLLVLREAFPRHRRLLAGVLCGALPWYFLHSIRWPGSPVATLVLAASLALLYSAETKRIAWAAVGGVMLGLSFNLRPDKLLLPVAIGVLWLLGRAIARSRGEAPGFGLPALLCFSCASWVMLLPWAAHYHAETGRYSLSSSNAGMVSYISLGQLPDNPWSVVHHDSFAKEVVQAEGVSAPAWSEAGNEVLMERFRQALRSHPEAYARKVLWNLRSMLMAGFYVGDSELPPEEQVRLDVLRERIKLELGVNPNLREIEQYQERGIWDRPQLSPSVVAFLAWQLIGAALGALFLWIALAGMLSAPRRILSEPLLLICAASVLYQIALVGALQYQPRHMNGVFLFLVPFFVIAVDRGLARIRRRRMPEPAQSRSGSE